MASKAMLMGKVMRTRMDWKAAYVRVPQMVLDDHLLMYFTEKSHFWASDPNGKSKEGDIVLIKAMDSPQSDKVKHSVREIVFPLGNITDPVTGRRCRGTDYIREDERKFGKVTIDSDDSDLFKW